MAFTRIFAEPGDSPDSILDDLAVVVAELLREPGVGKSKVSKRHVKIRPPEVDLNTPASE